MPSGGFLFVEYPFFNVGIELSVPAVVTNPTLHAVQAAINVVAKQVRLAACELERPGRGPKEQ